MRMFLMIVLLTSCLLFPGPAGAEEIRLSSTIGPIDAGIVPLLAKTYERETGVRVLFEGAGTGATLEKAKTGGFDLVMVHARRLEDAFVAEGWGVNRRDVMYNDFVILGPADDPAGIRGMAVAAEALAQLADRRVSFVTRGDMSGTHVKEMQLWEKAGLTPEGNWYEVYADGKKGNKATTLHANQRGAYVLTDRATYLMLKKDISLQPLVQGDPAMLNYIAIIAVNPEKFPQVNASGAGNFIDWLTGEKAQEIIRVFGVEAYGEPYFFPNAQPDQKGN